MELVVTGLVSIGGLAVLVCVTVKETFAIGCSYNLYGALTFTKFHQYYLQSVHQLISAPKNNNLWIFLF